MKCMNHLIVAALPITGLVFTLPAMAAESVPHPNHDGMQMNQAAMKGKLIRKTKINGYTLTYRLIDLHALMPNMANMAGTYHLMVTLTNPEGATIKKSFVGYLIKGPNGNVQKVMAMAMGDGFGANINLKTPGTYKIKVKALINDKPVIDAFS